MEYRKLDDGFAISDLNIAAGMLCTDGVSFERLEPRTKGNGYLFVLRGNPDKLNQLVNDWFHGKVRDDLHHFTDMVKYLKDQLFDEKRRGENNEQRSAVR